jgi:hypothetical protein
MSTGPRFRNSRGSSFGVADNLTSLRDQQLLKHVGVDLITLSPEDERQLI